MSRIKNVKIVKNVYKKTFGPSPEFRFPALQLRYKLVSSKLRGI